MERNWILVIAGIFSSWLVPGWLLADLCQERRVLAVINSKVLSAC